MLAETRSFGDVFAERWWIYLIIAVIAAVIVGMTVYSMSKSASKQSCQAQDYVKPDSFRLTHQENRYMGTTITRVPLQSNTRRR